MLSHHLIAALTLGMCYKLNGVQIGVLIALVHDMSHVLLEVCVCVCVYVSVCVHTKYISYNDNMCTKGCQPFLSFQS